MSAEPPQSSLFADPVPPRFMVGIDLGTTNCAVAYVDGDSTSKEVKVFSIEQWVDWQVLEARTTLPSFHYQWTTDEANQLRSHTRPNSSTPSYCVGFFARERGAQASDRQISSAKSWLCHSDIDRTSAILPWHAAMDVDRISPVEASSRYLRHIREAWDVKHPKHPLAECDVVVTLPASFDEVARELTIQAARMAGLQRIVLIEEPQAAFYAWLHRHERNWRETIEAGQTILICDIGGGTTDFTLIRVRESDAEDNYGLHRVAVGKHLMLGGDNLDVALAKAVEPRFLEQIASKQQSTKSAETQLTANQWESLRHQCRNTKESILSHRAPAVYPLSIAGSGSRLIGTTYSVPIDRSFVEKVLIDGFFPNVDLSDHPQHSQSGLVEFGLPYEADPAITRHLAQFLWEHRWAGRDDSLRSAMSEREAARPDWILFNGGVLESELIRDRIVGQVNQWFRQPEQATSHAIELPANESAPHSPTRVLESNQLDLAVAIGAAYFGRSRRGDGVRIDARLARAYYLQVGLSPPQAMCVMPADARTLDRFTLDKHPFHLETGIPVQFPIYVSSTHLVDSIGDIVPIDSNRMSAMPPIQTVIEGTRSKKRETLDIVVESELTEIGTLELSLRTASNVGIKRWKLDFDLRSTVETDRTAHRGDLEQSGIVARETIELAIAVVDQAFAAGASTDLAKNLVKRLTETLDQSRQAWKPSLLRAIWQAIIAHDEVRKRSQAVESRWINLLGYCLRPGYGFAADDWRVDQTWRKVHGRLQHAANAAELLILWRRIAGGFTAGQQRALFQELQGRLRKIFDGSGRSEPVVQDAVELVRLAGSLEHLPLMTKNDLAEAAIDSIVRGRSRRMDEPILWMLGRIGARSLAYGPINSVVSTQTVEGWIERIAEISEGSAAHQFAMMQLARRTGDRFRDVNATARAIALESLERWQAPPKYLQLVNDVAVLDASDRTLLLGDELPLGIQLRAQS